MLSGNPTAWESWNREQRVTALGYWEARTARGEAPPSIAPMSRWDVVRLLETWLDQMPGLFRFLFLGIITPSKDPAERP